MEDNDCVAWGLREITSFRKCDLPCRWLGMPQTNIKNFWPRWLAGRDIWDRETRRAPRRRA